MAAAFEELYGRWYQPVLALCFRRLGPDGDAEVVAQEAFVRAWMSWERFAGDRPFGPWVVTIARRLCVNESRAAERRRRLAEPPGGDRPTGEVVDIAVQRHQVRSALQSLPPRYRRVLCLRDVEGWSYAQIAGIDNVSVEAVRGALKRARAEFRRLYEAS